MLNEYSNLTMTTVLLPMALFYLAMILKMVDSFIVRKISKDHFVSTIPNGKEMALMSMVLDVVTLIGKNGSILNEFSKLGPSSINLIVPGLLFVIHFLIYVIITFTDSHLVMESYFRRNIVVLSVGMVALFTNSWTISSYINRF